jgi:hypothetical protein
MKKMTQFLLVSSLLVLLTPLTSFARGVFDGVYTPSWDSSALVDDDEMTPEEMRQEDLKKFAELQVSHQELMRYRKWKERANHIEQAVLYCYGPISVKITLGFILMEIWLEDRLSAMWPHFSKG